MAIPSTAVWEVRADGNDNNGGGFVASYGGTDYSQQAAPQLIGTTGACLLGDTQFTATENAFTNVMPGNILTVISGSGGTVVGRYVITAFSSANSITLDRSCAAVSDASGISYRIGGAVAHPSTIGATVVQSNVIHVRSGTYLVTSTTANVAGGRLRPTAHRTHWIGYGSTRNDNGTKPILQASGSYSGQPLIATNGTVGHSIRNFEIDGASKSTTNGIDFATGGSGGQVYFCYVHHCVNGVLLGSNGSAIATTSSNNSNNGFQDGSGANFPLFVYCFAKLNGGDGFLANSAAAMFAFCIAQSNTRHGINGGNAAYCIAYGNTSNGIMTSTNGSRWMLNNIAWGNGAAGLTCGGVPNEQAFFGNAHGGNGSVVLPTYHFGTIALSGDPFTNAAGGDFSLNNTAGAGAAVRATAAAAVAWPLTLPSGSTNYADIGAVQVAPSAGGVAAGWRGGIHE